MKRKIIEINEEKCSGCGACADACHEGAIAMVNGKAKLMREDYCDGLGDCLPACPADAIHFIEREAAAYDEEAVRKAKASASLTGHKKPNPVMPFTCPGMQAKQIKRKDSGYEPADIRSQLSHWPVQIKLAPVRAPYFHGANLLIAADCSAYAYGNFHHTFIKGRVVLIGCPKLDSVDYSEKLTAIIRENEIKSVTIVRMEVPCCGGLEYAAKAALKNSGKFVPWQVVTISTDGRILPN